MISAADRRRTTMKNQTFVYRIAALISYPVGYFYVRYVLFGITGTHEQIWPLLFSILLITCVEVFCCATGKSRSVLASCGQSAGESVFFAACSLVQSIAYTVFGLRGDTFSVVQVFFWHFTLIYYILCRTGMLGAGRSGLLFSIDASEGLFYLPWSNLFLRLVSVFKKRPADSAGTPHSQRSFRLRPQTALTAVISILLAIAVCAFAWSELSGVSSSFSSIGSSLSEFFRRLFQAEFVLCLLREFLPYFLLSIPVSAWLFGLTGGSLLRKEPPCTPKVLTKETKWLRVLPSWSAHVILGALTAVYLLFFAVSVREIGGQILSFRLTVQEACLYAVDGFWQLVRVVSLNFALLLASCLFSRIPLWEDRRTRCLITVQFICSLLFGLLAFWKLFVLYLGTYGATPRRILSGWMVIMLLLWTVLALIRFYRRIPAARISVLAAAASFSVLCLMPVFS